MKVIVPEGVLARELQGESVLLNLNTESYFGLDEVGTDMWRALTTSDSVEAAYQMLLTQYDVEPERLRQDLNELIEKLVEQGLIEIRDA